MRKWTIAIALLGLMLPISGAFAADDETSACNMPEAHRQFRGQVNKINKRELILDNRQGDKLKFKPAKDVTVEGEKTVWKKVKKNDWAIASWKMMDNPRIAYHVCVIPEVKEEGADVE